MPRQIDPAVGGNLHRVPRCGTTGAEETRRIHAHPATPRHPQALGKRGRRVGTAANVAEADEQDGP